MDGFTLHTPVVFLIFNRPDTTAKVFAEIRKARPSKLLVVADGPREGRLGEAESCAAARAVVDQGVDWPCEVIKNYSETNLGCKKRVVSGLDWAFSQVPEAIILEDDCVPEPTFFRFCQEMLEYYRSDERVFQVSGTNYLSGRYETPYSYYFSHLGMVWGWATWARAWKHYDAQMKLWPKVRDSNWLADLMAPAPSAVVRQQDAYFRAVHENRIDTWCYQWDFTLMLQHGLTLVSRENLIVNIGFDERATHTTKENRNAPRNSVPARFPLVHTPWIMEDADAHRKQWKLISEPLLDKVVRRAKEILDA